MSYLTHGPYDKILLMIGRRIRFVLLIATAVGARADQGLAQGVAEIVRQDLGSFRPGVVIALHADGELQFLEAFGERSSTTGEPLSTGDLFAYPAMSEILLSVMIEALHAAEVVDGDAPLSMYLPDLSPRVGRVSLRQLVSHTAGLDDASRLEGETWDETLDRIDDHAFVAEPGLFYSRSRHSFPLAGRALTAALRRPFNDLATTLILKPLGMTSSTFDIEEARGRGLVSGIVRSDDATGPTRDVEAVDTLEGLPVLFTNASDVVTFLSAWSAGQLSGSLPQEMRSGLDSRIDVDRTFGGGLWVDRYRGLARASRLGTQFGVSTGFYLLPETGSTIFIWWRGSWGGRTARFVLGAVTDVAGAPATVVPAPSRADAEETARPLPRADRWAGTYRNGDLIFVLRERDGNLVLFDGSRDLALESRGGSRIVAKLPDGRIAVRLDLIEDEAERRFLSFSGLVYRHSADELSS